MTLPSACTSGLRWSSSEENGDKEERKEEMEEDLDERLEMVLQHWLCPLGAARRLQRLHCSHLLRYLHLTEHRGLPNTLHQYDDDPGEGLGEALG